MKGARYIIGTGAFAGVVAISAFLLRPHPPQSQPVRPKSEQTKPTVSANTPSEGETSATSPLKTEETSLSLLGTVQSGARATLSTRLPARIVSVLVREGEAVKSGQRLLQLDDTDLRGQEQTARAGVAAARTQVEKARSGREAQRVKAEADLATAQFGLKQAQTKLQQAVLGYEAARTDSENERKLAQEGVRKAEAGLAQARRTLTSLEELRQVGGVSRNDLEGARTQVAVALSDLETARTQLQRLDAGPGAGGDSYRVVLAKKDREAAEAGVQQAREGVKTATEAKRQIEAIASQDIRAAEAALYQAQAGASTVKQARESLLLTSPLSGVVSSVSARVGETAQPGMPLVTVFSLSGLRVEALVTARQLSQLRTGQEAKITVETQPGRTFPAIVSEIAHTAEPDGRTFRILFRLRDSSPDLRPNQSARITIGVGR